MDAHTFVSSLLSLPREAAKQFITEHAPEVDDLDAAAQLLKDEAQAQETRDVELSLAIADLLLAFADQTGNPRHHALGLLARGNVLMRQGYHREAIDCFDAAGADFLKADDEIGWARTRISFVFCASRIGAVEQALQYVERAREIFLSHKEYGRAADLETNRAIALAGIGRYPEALAAYDRILLIITSMKTSSDTSRRKARVLTNKAFVLEMLGDLHGAIACLQEARAILAEQKQHQAVAAVDRSQATLRTELGQYSAALHLYHQAREYYQQHALPNALATANINMADCLLRLNRPAEALRLGEEAIAIYHTLDETFELGWALIYLARAQAACGKTEAALTTLAEARQQFEHVGDHPSSGMALLALAELLMQSKDQLAQSLAKAEEAITIFQAHHMEHWIAEAHLLQGRAYEISGNETLAAELSNKALKEAQQARIPWLEFGCEHLFGRLMQRQGDLEAAEKHYQAALTILEGLMTWLVPDQRSMFLIDKEDVFNALISLSLKRNNPSRALEYLERMKSQVLREYLTRSSEIRLKASDPEEARLLQELQRLRQELHVYSSQATTTEMALQSPSLGEQIAAVRGAQSIIDTEPALQNILLRQQKDEQRRIERAISELLERAYLQHESSRFALLATEQGAHLAHNSLSIEHLADLLPEGSLLVEYFIQQDDLLIFTLHARHHHVEVTNVPSAAPRLSRLLPLFRTNIDLVAQQLTSQPVEANFAPMLNTNIHGLACKLYDLLLRPIQTHLPIDGRLIIVPYGPLHLLPFHALHSGAGYLIEQCEVAYLPAAAMLALQERQHPADRLDKTRRRNVLVLGHSLEGRLPHAAHEAKSVASLFETSPYLDAQATITQLSSAGDSYAIIHIAAHGENRADAPDFSFLQLADGQLSMIDVFNLDLPAELISLSGCETGLAVIGGGDELLGLGRGFLYAGARSLLMSLWRVEDASTAQLMERFYQGLLAGQSRAGALRCAQQALLADARAGRSPAAWQHPYFWAPFRLLGASDPIAF